MSRIGRFMARLPWTRLQHGFQEQIRRRFFRLEGAHPYQLLDADRQRVKEVLNMRRIESRDREGRFWQTHVRGFTHPDGFVVCPHFELCPVEHPASHLDKVGLNVPIGMRNAAEIWEANGIDVIEESSLEESPPVDPTAGVSDLE